MTRHRNLMLALSGLLVVLIGLIAIVGTNLAQASDDIPDPVYACLPASTQESKLWGTVETTSGDYYLIGISRPGDPDSPYQEVLVYLPPQNPCRSLLPEDDPVLSHYIPLNLARELALQRYTRVLQEQGGREAYQRDLLSYLEGAPEGTLSQFPPEYLWALEQLGIELPPQSYEVLP